MHNTVKYEWDYEEFDPQSGDILDHNHQDHLSQYDSDAGLGPVRLVLIRNTGNDADGLADGLADRLWAYVKDGKLPEFFTNELGNDTGYIVPIKYHVELAKYLQL